MNIRVLLTLAVIVAVVGLFAAPASAAAIALLNPLFEDPTSVGPLSASAPGQFPYASWQGAGVDTPYDSTPDGTVTTYPSCWVGVNGTDPGNNITEKNPSSADFSSAAGNGLLPSPAGVWNETINGKGALVSSSYTSYGANKPALGSQACYNDSAANNDPGFWDNDIAVLANTGAAEPSDPHYLLKNMTYTETIAVGNGKIWSEGWFAGFGIEIADATAGVNLANVEFPSNVNPAQDSFTDYSLSFNTNDFITTKGTIKAGDVVADWLHHQYRHLRHGRPV